MSDHIPMFKSDFKILSLTWTGNELGLNILPQDVRLKTSQDDDYRWKIVKGRGFEPQLLRCHLSKLSSGTYLRLCRAIGDSIEVVPFDGQYASGQVCAEI